MSTTIRTHFARFVDAARDTLRRLARHEKGLADLDDRTLADIGVSRSEIASIEAEAHSRRRPTRRRIVAAPRHA
jgi:uncharacterized protein YjiS (DUF1127 family)